MLNSSTLDSNLLIMDTVTGGLDPNRHSLLSIGLVSACGEHQRELFVLEDELCTNPESMIVNGIDLDWLKANAKSPQVTCDLIDELLEAIPGDQFVLVGHNIAFDLSFLRRLYHLAERPMPSALSHRSIDTHSLLWMLAQRGLIPERACSSDGAFQHFNVAPTEELRHTALGDAVATRLLLVKILELSERLS